MRRPSAALAATGAAAVLLLLAACGSGSPSATSAASSGGGSPSAHAAPSTAQPASSAEPATSPQPAASAMRQVSGTVASVASGRLTLQGGGSFGLGSATHIIVLTSVTAADLKVGQYVAVTAKRQPNGTLLASIVNVFPPSMRGTGVGQRPMAGGDLMTNATIHSISGDSFTVTFPGGGAHVQLAPSAKVNLMALGKASDIRAGDHVRAAVSKGIARFMFVQR